MTLLLPTDDAWSDEVSRAAGGPGRPATAAPLSQRLVTRTSRWLARGREDRGRRSFLTRAALVGTALAVNPFDFILRPQSAYATVCGPSNECSQGWTAFCCTVNGGANTCPPGSYAAGWWKVTSSAFCRGGDRYIIDCNRLPSASCSCRCASGTCDRRRVCCNNFRYGQCNQQVAGVTQVVCRVIICTPPWEWDETCTTTVRTDNRTRDHSAPCLPGTNPTIIEITYQDLGLVGSALGAPIMAETAGPAGGSWRSYENGAISHVEAFGTAVLIGPAGLRYTQLDGPNGPLGYITGDPMEVTGGQVLPAEGGALYTGPDGQAFEVTGVLHDTYNAEGGPTGWLGFPRAGVTDAPGGRRRIDFAAGWSLVLDVVTDEVRLLPADVQLPDQEGVWPDTADVTRWAGDDRVATAARVSAETLPDGAEVAVVAGSGSVADALAGGVLAGSQGGPVLLTARDGLSSATGAELQRLEVQTVYVVGGNEVVSDQVIDDIADAVEGVQVVRLAGDSRFATAVAVSAVLAPDGADVVYLTSGREFADALAATPLAAGRGAPMLLAEPTQLPRVTADELARLSPDLVVLIGGEAALTREVGIAAGNAARADVQRIAGDSRFDTAAAVVEETTEGTAETVLIATGDTFADALAAGAASAAAEAPLLLVRTSGVVPGVTRHAIERLQPSRIVVVGGEAAVAAEVSRQLAAIPV
ncbi:MAG TPA: cell wall-binding repeat-containing protein, partial [Euzebya sp.]|nr:cell wall-binding repeat-containing protein [Euzebya sp.]